MIDFVSVINRIKLKAPVFQSRVGATASFNAALGRAADIAVPYCFVLPLDFKDYSLLEYEEKFPEKLKEKVMRETFATVVCIDNSMARGGQEGGTNGQIPLSVLNTLQSQLEIAFAEWKPDGLTVDAGDINLLGGEYMDSDNSRLWWQFEWFILWKRYNVAIDPAIQEQIDSVVNENEPQGTDIQAVDTLHIRNNLSAGRPLVKQPSVEDDFLLLDLPEPLPATLVTFDEEADLIEFIPEGTTNPTNEEIKAAMTTFPHQPDPIYQHGVSVDEDYSI